MANVERADVNYMTDLLKQLDNLPTDSSSSSIAERYSEGGDHIAPPALGNPKVSGKEKDQMKKLLEMVDQASEHAIIEAESSVTSFADKDSVKEALLTERTSRGSRIGRWEIVVIKEDNHKTYNVVDDNGTVIASGLYLYEAALLFTKALNKGLPVNDEKVKKILKLEESYVNKIQDMQTFKETRNVNLKKGNIQRAAIAEDRLTESQRQAKELLDRMVKLAGLG